MKQYILKCICKNRLTPINERKTYGEFLSSNSYYARTKENTTSDRSNLYVFSEDSMYYRNYSSGKNTYWEVVPFYELDKTSKTPYYDLYESLK